jgi:hypothetical protein
MRRRLAGLAWPAVGEPPRRRNPYPLRLPADLYDWLVTKAAQEQRSINNLIIVFLRRIRDEESNQKGEVND